ncbi:MAG: hypothetical protein H6R26_706 [Proteobacteria bacterium]|nr:hypothetical protein [Pseudomonadota bacterium]
MISATTPIAKPLVGLALLAAATGAGAVLWSWLEPLDVPSGADAGPSALSATDPAHEKRWNELNSQEAAASWTEVFQREGIKDELKGIQLGTIDCRTSLCRVEVTPSDAGQGTEAFAQKLQKLPLFAPWQAPGFGKIENPDEGAPVGVFYLAREGHALP